MVDTPIQHVGSTGVGVREGGTMSTAVKGKGLFGEGVPEEDYRWIRHEIGDGFSITE